MKNKFLITANKDIEEYKKVGFTTFLFPFKDYTVGYLDTYTIEEINKYSETNNYVLINRLLNTKEVYKLKEILGNLKVTGFVIEDIGLYNIIKDLNLNTEIILFQNHLNTNYKSINYYLNKGFESVFVSNELSLEELETIDKNALKPIIIQGLGHNQMMYSRRKLLTNFNEEFNYENKNILLLKEKISHQELLAVENDYGTVMYTDKIFNGLKEITNLDNIKYIYINPTFIKFNNVIKYLHNENDDNTDTGFLYQKTIYKLKDK